MIWLKACRITSSLVNTLYICSPLRSVQSGSRSSSVALAKWDVPSSNDRSKRSTRSAVLFIFFGSYGTLAKSSSSVGERHAYLCWQPGNVSSQLSYRHTFFVRLPVVFVIRDTFQHFTGSTGFLLHFFQKLLNCCHSGFFKGAKKKNYH